jgi:hypothetical protein
VHSSEEPLSDPAHRRALELAMREALGGMEELSLAVAYAHLDFSLPQVADAAPAHTAAVIPFPRLRRAAAG